MDKLLSWEEVHDVTGMSRTTVWRWEKDGEFPARRKIGPNRVGWLRSELQAWMEGLPPADSTEAGS